MIRQRIAIISGIVVAIGLLIAAPYVLSDFYLSTLNEILEKRIKMKKNKRIRK